MITVTVVMRGPLAQATHQQRAAAVTSLATAGHPAGTRERYPLTSTEHDVARGPG